MQYPDNEKKIDMKVTINQSGSTYAVTLEGRVDTTSADQFLADIKPLCEAEKPEITMDCAKMEYTSSQGLRIFLTLQKCVMAHGGSLVLTNMDPKVREVFDITGFSGIIRII